MIQKINNKTIYSTRKEAETKRKKNQSIYYVHGIGYYIVKTSKHGFWDKIL